MENENFTILIVDDEKELINLYSDSIKNLPVNVLTASDGVAALDVLEKNTVHFILLDLTMPRKNGFEVLQEINKRYPDILTVVSTETLLKEAQITDLINSKVCSFLIKPTSEEELHSCIASLEDHYLRNRHETAKGRREYEER